MTSSELYLKVKDYSVSQKEFSLYLDTSIDLLATTPQPTSDELGSYYESEDYISHTDSSRSWFEKIYQFIKKTAIQQKLKLVLAEQKNKGILLDIGCGTGDFLAAAKSSGWQVKGYEPNEKARNIALQKGVELTYSTEDLKDNSVDVITMWHVLEHVPDVKAQITELKRLVKPGGTIIIAVPNYKSFDAHHYQNHWAAYDVPRHLWHFSKKSIQSLFAAQGLELVQVKPMWFDSFYVSLLSEKYKTGKMNMIQGFWIGLCSNLSGMRTKEFSSHIYIIKKPKSSHTAV
nr:class I SAM-dependent methyltransferase [Flavobacterium sp. CYK-55]